MEKITKEFCKNKTLLFYPETESEAAFIQQRIFDMGFKWGETGVTNEIAFLPESVETGLTLRESGVVYYDPAKSTRAIGLVCTIEGSDLIFDKKNPANMTEKELLIYLFNQVSQLTKEVADIKAEISPKHLNKDGFKPK